MVTALAFSPGNQLIASGDFQGVVKLWSTAIGNEIKSFKRKEDLVGNLSFSPNGEAIIVRMSGLSTYLWSLKSDKEVKLTKEHSDDITAIAFSANSKIMASGSRDKTIKLWDIPSGRVIGTCVGHKYAITCVAFSPDDNFIASGSEDKSVKVWSVSNGKEINSFTGHSGGIYAIAYSPNGKYIASGGGGDFSVKLWDTEAGKEIASIAGESSRVTGICFSDDSRSLAIGNGNGNSKVYEIATKREVANAPKSMIVFWPNGKVIALKYDDNAIYLSDAINGRPFSTINGVAGLINTVAFSPKGEYLAVGSLSGRIKLWQIAADKDIIRNDWNTPMTLSVAFSPDGKYITAGSGNETIKLWELASGREVRSFKGNDLAVSAVSISPDGRYLATGAFDNTIVLWELAASKKIRKLTGHSTYITSLAFSPDGNYLVSQSTFAEMKLWEIRTGKEVRTYSNSKPSPAVAAFSPNGKYIAVALADKCIKLIDVASGSELKAFNDNSDITSIAFSPNGKYIASGNEAYTINLWDVETGGKANTLKGHGGKILAVAFSPDGKQIASGGTDGTVKLWDVEQGVEMLTFITASNDLDDWLLLTPDRYYYSSKSALSRVHYVKGVKTFSFDQFDLQYNRPDIVLQRLGRVSPEIIQLYRGAYEKRLRRMGFDPTRFDKEFRLNAPEVNIASANKDFIETSEPEYSIKFTADDKLYNLDRYMVKVNGVPLYGSRGMALPPKTKTIEKSIRIPLSTGINQIRISAINEKGVESLAEQVNVNFKPATPVKPALLVVSIGVSKFIDPDFNLTYADKDATDMAKLMEQRSNAFGSTKVNLVMNEDATRDNVLRLRNNLLNTSPDDQVVVFVATHGLLDANLDYYLAMHNTDFANPQRNGLRYDELEGLLDGIPARKKMLLMDACHSGEVDKDESILVESSTGQSGNVKSRGFKAVANKSGVGLRNSFDLMQQLFADLSNGSGAMVISSAGGAEYAFESPQWNNGVFTYSVLEGLKTGNADKNKDKTITVSELRDYVIAKVQALTNGKQTPTSRKENLEFDFRVW
jgi:WD40 repeat protein